MGKNTTQRKESTKSLVSIGQNARILTLDRSIYVPPTKLKLNSRKLTGDKRPKFEAPLATAGPLSFLGPIRLEFEATAAWPIAYGP